MSSDSQSQPIKVHRFVGNVTGLDIFQAQQDWFEDPQFDQNMPILWDLTGAIINLDEAQLATFTKGAIRFSKKNRPQGRAAILVSTADHYELLFHAYELSIAEGRMKICLSDKEARAWLE